MLRRVIRLYEEAVSRTVSPSSADLLLYFFLPRCLGVGLPGVPVGACRPPLLSGEDWQTVHGPGTALFLHFSICRDAGHRRHGSWSWGREVVFFCFFSYWNCIAAFFFFCERRRLLRGTSGGRRASPPPSVMIGPFSHLGHRLDTFLAPGPGHGFDWTCEMTPGHVGNGGNKKTKQRSPQSWTLRRTKLVCDHDIQYGLNYTYRQKTHNYNNLMHSFQFWFAWFLVKKMT